MSLWSEKALDMISIFKNLVRLVVWPDGRSTLENVGCALEKNACSATLVWNVPQRSMKSIRSNVSFQVAVPLLIFCLEDLSVDVSGGYKPPTMTVVHLY